MRENEASPLFLARINNFESDVDEHGHLTMAQVIPATEPDIVTRPFPIHWSCRGPLGGLNAGDLVVCARFADGSGIILSRADGGCTYVFPDVTAKSAHVGTLAADVDVTAGGKSLAHHKHNAAGGVTSEPI